MMTEAFRRFAEPLPFEQRQELCIVIRDQFREENGDHKLQVEALTRAEPCCDAMNLDCRPAMKRSAFIHVCV